MPTQADEEKDVRAVIDAVTRGLREKDAAAVVRQYTSDALIFDLAPPLSHPIDREQLAAWLDTWDGPVQQELKDHRVVVRGDLAFTHALVHVSARTKDGEQAAWWMRATSCLVRQSEGWRIVHEHTSVPFHMDGSFRAAIDLSP